MLLVRPAKRCPVTMFGRRFRVKHYMRAGLPHKKGNTPRQIHVRGGVSMNLGAIRGYVSGAAALLFFVAFAGQASAAKITLLGTNVMGQQVVVVSGKIDPEDVERFQTAVNGLDNVLVVFDSPGGSLGAGLDIGTRIRL